MWWWDYATQEPEAKELEFLEIVDDDPASVGHLVGWMEDCPDVLHCYTGDLPMSELSAHINAAINHPCPAEFSPSRVNNMVEHIQSGIPLFVEDTIERMKEMLVSQAAIVSVKEAQYERKQKALEDKKRKSAERASSRKTRVSGSANKKTKKEPAAEEAVGEVSHEPGMPPVEYAEVSSGSSLSSSSDHESGPKDTAATPQPANPPPKPRTKLGGQGLERERAKKALQEKQSDWDAAMGQHSEEKPGEEGPAATAAPTAAEPVRTPTSPTVRSPPPSPRARSSSSRRSSDPRQPFRAPKLAPGAQSPSEMLRQRLSYSKSPAPKK